MPAGRLQGKVAIVTGSGDGIGKGVALMFARQGARVVGCDIDATKAEATQTEAISAGLEFSSLHPIDLTTPDGAERAAALAVERYGSVDVLVNAAAVGVFAYIDQMTYADWRRTMVGELDIVFLACKAVWPRLVERGSGSIINFASANARQALPGSGALAHCAGKGGVLAMTRQLAMEGGPYNIRANTISPGLVVTAATRPVIANPTFEATVLSRAMIKRLGQPEDVAAMACFLASDEASWITGADFAVDGGATAW